MNLKQKLIDLAATRTAALDRASAAYQANDVAAYSSAMDEVTKTLLFPRFSRARLSI